MKPDLEIYLYEFDGSYKHLVKADGHDEALFESLHIDDCYEFKFYESGHSIDNSIYDEGRYHEGDDDYDTIDWIPEDVTKHDISIDDTLQRDCDEI